MSDITDRITDPWTGQRPGDAAGVAAMGELRRQASRPEADRLPLAQADVIRQMRASWRRYSN